MLVFCEAAQECWRRQDFGLLQVGKLVRGGEGGGAEKLEREREQKESVHHITPA